MQKTIPLDGFLRFLCCNFLENAVEYKIITEYLYEISRTHGTGYGQDFGDARKMPGAEGASVKTPNSQAKGQRTTVVAV